ncbi:gliding motility-associated C-terminal domain-containing protein [Flavobacterium sangjuense]|uniref:Ig-like domain-containing protein n=1 Tax=Flavobacterium sangjuense TaxID=2518177 RepID=A0A4V1CBY9_9FLAO|nr:gliding motility-associated C-terminal domain-containing protein [Flavobacterium sangjuense]QBZ97644.1 hypothetical protein GS03_01142 [Flavobacterium sangjuense]
MLGKRLYLFLTFLFFVQFAQGQLSNFTLNVTATNETCPSNGTLTFAVSNTTTGSTFLYSVYLLPDVTTPISVQSATTISGLPAGNYRVVATQSLGGESGTQQQDATIVNTTSLLTYQTTSTNEICGNDGTITVNVTTGTAASYQIISGPMTRPLQTSNLFTGLTAGVYQIRVVDTCGQAVVQTYTLFKTDTNINFTLMNPSMVSCTMANIGASFQPALSSGIIRYPLQIVIVFSPPTGPSITYNQTLTTGNGFSQQVPYFPNSNYSFTITDGCGTVYNLNGVIEVLPPIGGPGYTVGPQDCDFQLINFSNVTSLILVSAPPGYAGTLPQNFDSSIVNAEVVVHDVVPGTYIFNVIDACGNPQTVTVIVSTNQGANPPYYVIASPTCIDVTLFVYDVDQLIMISAPPTYTVPLPHDYSSLINSAHYAVFVHLPVGTYVFNVVDRCGNALPMTVVITSQTNPPTVSVREGCENGFGSFRMSGDLIAVSITSAPTAYTGPVPADLSGNIVSSGTRFTMDSLPPGSYSFQSTNSCGGTFTTNITILGYQQNTNVVIAPNCGSFNLTLNHTSNNNFGATYWLQKFDAASGNWVHPLTDIVYTDGSFPTTTNSFELTNNGTTFNIAFVGHFRILKVFNVFTTGISSQVNCFKVIYEFDFYNVPRIIDVFPVSCGSTFEVVVNAVGNSALVYRITTKNGLPFLVENGSSNLFSGLEPGTYNFEVEDVCHNSANSQFQVLNPAPMTIASSISCDGQSASLTVANFPFLTYQWWKDNNTTTILSTTNSLNFSSFNSALDNGTYHVRITYLGNPASCLNQVLDYEVNINNTTPQAGNDNTVSYCGRQGVIDMTTLLTGTFQPLGTWTEITTSGTLTNNLWDSSTVPFGIYQFKYTVIGSCASTDDATINITIKAIPETPVASADPILCETQNVNLFATFVANGNYNWTGPNGFASTLQNPTINSVSVSDNGTYTVNVTQNGCQSGNSSVEVLVNPLPSFTLNQSCVGKDYQLWYTRQNETSFDEATSTFSWTGPNNYTSNQNPITITGGELGVYSLSITNQFGCEVTNTIDVVRNICFIPNVITPNNDQTNESLDLTGFGVDKLEIYNRWGRKVYEKSNYSDEWHGQNMNGGILPDSTYYYIIKLDTAEIKNGWIFLTRG